MVKRLLLCLVLALVFASVSRAERVRETPQPEQDVLLSQADVICTYVIDPLSQNFGYLATDAVVIVTAPPLCAWTVDNQNDWVQIHFFTNGVGNGTVRYTVFDNPNPFPRMGILTIGGQEFDIFQDAAPCGYSILPTSSLASRLASTNTVTVFTADSCPWSASSASSWLTITSATNGVGNGVVDYSVAPSYSPTERTGTLSIAGQTLKVVQLGTPCRYTLSGSLSTYSFNAATGSVSVTTTTGCYWDVVNSNNWIQVTSSTNSTASGTVRYRVAVNASTLSRTGILTVAGQSLTVRQAGAPCTYSLNPQGRGHGAGAETGSINVSALPGCNWAVQNSNSWVGLTAGVSGAGNGIVSYQLSPNKGPARSGALVIAGQVFSVSQTAPVPPALTSLPASQAVAAGTAVSFSVGASGTVPLSYQWRLNGTNLTDGPFVTGSSTALLTLPNVQSWQAGNYSVVVSNIGGTVTSPVSALLVNTAPRFNPITDKTVSAGAPVVFRVVATDPDIPAQTLTYSLIGTTLAGASLDAPSGTFTWPSAQGPSANTVAIRVTDNGTPALSATQKVVINVVASTVTNQILVSTGSVWRYYDKGTDLGTGWITPSYNDTTWASGAARLGYGIGNEATVVSFGSSSSSKYITTYFRGSFTVNAPSSFSALRLRVLRDDGVVVYLNGVEVYRNNMPSGTINYRTLAASSVPSTNYTTYFISPFLDPAVLVAGVNVLSAEIHKASASSATLAFALELSGSQNFTAPAPLSQPKSQTVVQGSDAVLSFLVAGAPPLVHQWYFNGSPLPNATLDTLLLPDVVLSQSGGYFDVVSNPLGSVTSAVAALTVILPGVNTAPVFAPLGNKTAIRGTLATFTATATDGDVPAQTLTYSLDPGAPAGATINPSTGLFTWTASASQVPTVMSVPIRVTDSGTPPLSTIKTVTITVVDGVATSLTLIPTLSVWKYQDTGQDLGTAWTGAGYDDTLWKSGPGLLGYAGGSEATVVSYGPNSGAKYITTYFRRTITLSDPSLLSAMNVQVRRDDGVVVYINGVEVYRDNMPAGPVNYLTPAPLSVSGTDKTMYHTSAVINATMLLAGPNVVSAEVHQHSGSSTSMDFDLGLTGSGLKANNIAPVLGPIPNTTVLAGSPVTFTASATDADFPAQTLTYSLDAGAPAGASINPASGAFTWTPALPQGLGTTLVTVRVTDNGSPALSDFATFAITVTTPAVPSNTPPVLAAIGNKTVLSGNTLTLTASGSDNDVPAQALAYSLDPGAPAGASIDPASGLFTWTPTAAQAPSTNSVTVRVTDNGSPPMSAFQNFIVFVTAPVIPINTPPLLVPIGNKTVQQGALLTFSASASDSDVPTQTLTYSLDPGAPSGAHIDPATGVFTWTPSATQSPSTNLVTVRVTDNGSPPLSASATILITVTPIPSTNNPPVLTAIGRKTVLRGNVLTFTATATDPDIPAQTLSFSLDPGAPAGASIDPASGVFTWTANVSEVPSTINVTIRVTDNGSPSLSDARTAAIAVVDGVTTNLTLIPTLSVWNYEDTGENLGTAWTAPAYDDSLWQSGPGLLGYGGGGEATVVGYGPNSSSKYITTYFRQAMIIPDPSLISGLIAQVRRDDGVVVYINGVEVFRDNMPAGPINYLTVAPLSVSGTDKTSYHASGLVPPSMLVAGLNVVAAEVHQHSGSGSSMDFDLGLSTTAIKPNNTAPVLAPIPNASVLRSNLFTFTASGTDRDYPAQALTFSLDAGAPAGASINPTTGVFTWTPVAAQTLGINTITVRVTDNGSPPMSDFKTFTVLVQDPSLAGLTIGSTNGPAGSQVTVPILANRFTNVALFQFSLHWDPSIAGFVDLEQLGLAGIAFGTEGTNNGTLTVSWDDTGGQSQTLAPGAPVFVVRFQLTTTPGVGCPVWIDGTPTPIEVADAGLRVIPLNVIAGQITTGGTNAAQLVDEAFPRFLSIRVDTGGAVIFSWRTFAGRTYQVQYAPDLLGTQWTNLGDLVPGNGSVTSMTDAPGTVGQRFYRIVRFQ